jgi:hypothetical protein
VYRRKLVYTDHQSNLERERSKMAKKTGRKVPRKSPGSASKTKVAKPGTEPDVRFSEKLTASLEEVVDIIDENKATLDAIQDIALEVTRVAGFLQATAAKYARMVDSVLDTAVPILQSIPLVSDKVLDVIVELQELANNILDICTTADKVIPDVEQGLMKADVVRLQKHSGELQKVTKALQKVLPAS